MKLVLFEDSTGSLKKKNTHGGGVIKNMLMAAGGLMLAMLALACGAPLAQEELGKEVKCEAIWYTDPSENEQCYKLQELLSHAAISGDVAGVKNAIKNGANVNGGYYESLPVLEAASAKGKTDVVIVLIQAGAQLNRVRPLGQTALKSAVYNGHKEAVKALLGNGADVCEKTDASALQYATKAGDFEMVDILIRAGAKDCE